LKNKVHERALRATMLNPHRFDQEMLA